MKKYFIKQQDGSWKEVTETEYMTAKGFMPADMLKIEDTSVTQSGGGTPTVTESIKPTHKRMVLASAVAAKVGGDPNSSYLAQVVDVFGAIPPTSIKNENVTFVENQKQSGVWIALSVSPNRHGVRYISVLDLVKSGKIDLATMDIEPCVVSRADNERNVTVM